jgi:hypothetical protein
MRRNGGRNFTLASPPRTLSAMLFLFGSACELDMYLAILLLT